MAVAGEKKVIRRVGGVRPSQLMYAFGIGAIVDLPNFSVLVGGLDDWDEGKQAIITEDRLLAAVRSEPGLETVRELRSAPWEPETRSAFDSWAFTGVPVTPFPRWLRCSRCAYLGPIDSGLFELETSPYRPDRARYVHRNCSGRGRAPTAVPARFVVACSRGHLDEFPWVEFVHKDAPCSGNPILEALDLGTGSRSTDVMIRCRTCQQKGFMAQAFGEGAEQVLPLCRARSPQLRRFDATSCPEQTTAMLLGASNAWFAVTRTVLSIPASADATEQLVADHWAVLGNVSSATELPNLLRFVPDLKALAGHDPADVWAAIEARRATLASQGTGSGAERDLVGPEWDVFTHPDAAPTSDDFKLVGTRPPDGFATAFEPTVLVERLREVTALIGFTRVDGPDAEARNVAAIARRHPTWVPAAQSRGEGIFLRLREERVAAWEDRVAGTPRMEALRLAHQSWRRRRGLDPAALWPGERYVLLHSLAHALINELALECGYSAASIRERIYANQPGGDRPPMAGVLLYTAAPDAEGTLGGLVSLGRPEFAGQMLARAIDRMHLCTSDPMCAVHCPDENEDVLHCAACHACLFVPETSCERGNRYLDRAALCSTLAEAKIGYLEA
jgi:hypothetical protein